MIITKSFGADIESRVKALYDASFPPSEKKPYALIEKKRDEGFMELYALLEDSGEFLGLAFFILHGDIALLDYFAIDEEVREMGYGTDALDKLTSLFPSRTLLLEIEDPDEPGADNTVERVRRRSFYTKCGMKIMPYKVLLFGVQMLILTFKNDVEFSDYHRVFEVVFGEKAAKKVNLI